MHPITTLDYIVLIVYLAGVVGLGCLFAFRGADVEQFTAARRNLPGWVVGLSIFGTFVSSISFLANPGKSFDDNWNPFVFSLSLPLAAWIAVRWFVPFYRQAGEISAYHHLERRFGAWARTYAVACYLLTQIARVGTIMFLVALALAPLLDWDVATIIIVTGVLVTLYTLLGGIEAVIWTDVVQSLVLIGGMAASAAVLLMRMPGGPGELFEIAQEHNKFSLGSFGLSLTSATFWVTLAYGLFINLQNFGIDQSYVQRYITARDDRAAQRSVWLGALMYLPISAMLFFIGTGLFAFYRAAPEHATYLPVAENGKISGDAVFPHFIANELPPGMTGVVIAAILAAAMSSVDSSLNGAATLTLRDLYQRFVRPQAGNRESMLVLYAATVIFGVIGTGAALAMMQVRNVLDAWWALAGMFSGGMLGLFLLGLLSRRATGGAALAGTLAGIAMIAWLSLSNMKSFWPDSWAAIRSPFHSHLTIVFGTLTILLVGFLVATIFDSRRREPAP